MKRESGSEVKMPVAAEEAQYHWPDWPKTTARIIADIQRRTILACAQFAANCWTTLPAHAPAERIAEELERLAASLGEPGK